jgi:cell division septum initiation protein DivIVA
MNGTMERLHQLLDNSNREKERLLKENESLKREVERLRKKQMPPTIDINVMPQQSILKTPISANPF